MERTGTGWVLLILVGTGGRELIVLSHLALGFYLPGHGRNTIIMDHLIIQGEFIGLIIMVQIGLAYIYLVVERHKLLLINYCTLEAVLSLRWCHSETLKHISFTGRLILAIRGQKLLSELENIMFWI